MNVHLELFLKDEKLPFINTGEGTIVDVFLSRADAARLMVRGLARMVGRNINNRWGAKSVFEAIKETPLVATRKKHNGIYKVLFANDLRGQAEQHRALAKRYTMRGHDRPPKWNKGRKQRT